MKYYPWNLEDLTKKFLAHEERRYSQKHLQFIGFAFKGILLAVEELHKAGFVHRDLKLDNFMVDSECNYFTIQSVYTSTTSN
jgi:serine/threonine protein kinase